MERIRSIRIATIATVFGALFIVVKPASAVAINFNDFFHAAGAPVDIAADGSTAQLFETSDTSVVFLSDVPGFGDPNLVTAQSGTKLSFNFDFVQPAGNDDEFHVAILDGTNGNVLAPAFEAFFASSSSGLIEFDLSSLVGSLLGLQFELGANPDDQLLSSSLTLSNLQIIASSATPIPEPSIFSLFGMSALLLSVSLVRRRRSETSGDH